MQTTTITRQFRWFWAWDDDKEEAWLRDMSNQGTPPVEGYLSGDLFVRDRRKTGFCLPAGLFTGYPQDG